VIVALIIGLAGSLMFQRGDIAKQEADLPVSEA
jgi:NCS1 family nucleobase:cation symporter-1